MEPREIEVIDSHTEGEPTRVVIAGWPMPEGATMFERREHMRAEHDALRRAVVLEPRGHEAIVGALLTDPVEPDSACGVVFFNNVGYLGMCGHGLIGVVRTLESLGRVQQGELRLDTPVGTVGATLHEDGSVSIANVPARVSRLDVALDVPVLGAITGDIAWGGNWFFLVHHSPLPLELENVAGLTRATLAIQAGLEAQGIRGDDGGAIDHVELFGPPRDPRNHSRNFVLCPGGAYDRSPCGTGTSAKLAVLHARGELAIGSEWRQESIADGLFHAWLTNNDGQLIPHIRGRAFVTARSTLLLDPRDPLRHGLGAR